MENKYRDWIERFGTLVDNQLGEEIKKKVLVQCISCQKISNDKEMAKYVKEVMIQFDQEVPDSEKRYGVMEAMGNICFHNFFGKIAEDIKKKSDGIVELIHNINKMSGGEYFKLEDNKIYAKFNLCLCQVGVKETEEPIPKTYCNCSLGWMKGLFNTLLDKPFDVEMLDSIVSGGKSCQFVISLE
jgi:hypothetical protein